MNYLTKDYKPYHLSLEAVHAVKDWCYVRKLIRAARKGDSIPPIIYDGNGFGGVLYNGTHRHAANTILAKLGEDALIDYLHVDNIDNQDVLDAIANCDYDTIDSLLDR